MVGDFGQQKTDTSTISSFERIYLRKPTRQFGQQADKPPETTYSDSGRRAGPGLGSEKLRAQCFQSEEIGQTANLAASEYLYIQILREAGRKSKLGNAAVGQLRDDHQFSKFEPSRENVFAECGDVVLVAVGHFFDQTM